jgi:hypothetical protein
MISELCSTNQASANVSCSRHLGLGLVYSLVSLTYQAGNISISCHLSAPFCVTFKHAITTAYLGGKKTALRLARYIVRANDTKYSRYGDHVRSMQMDHMGSGHSSCVYMCD